MPEEQPVIKIALSFIMFFQSVLWGWGFAQQGAV
jgi:hypothetical protein